MLQPPDGGWPRPQVAMFAYDVGAVVGHHPAAVLEEAVVDDQTGAAETVVMITVDGLGQLVDELMMLGAVVQLAQLPPAPRAEEVGVPAPKVSRTAPS